MLSFAGSLRIFIALDPCDMRAGVNTLHALVGDRLKEDSRSGTLFVFTNRRRKLISRSPSGGAETASRRLPEGRPCREAAWAATCSTGMARACG